MRAGFDGSQRLSDEVQSREATKRKVRNTDLVYVFLDVVGIRDLRQRGLLRVAHGF